MIEIMQRDDGQFAVRDVGGPVLDDVLGLFASRREAQEWLLDRSLRSDARDDAPRPVLPGDGQGLD